MSTLEITLDTEEQLAAGARSRAYALLAEAVSFPDPPLAARFATGDWLDEFTGIVNFLPFAFELADASRRQLACAPSRDVLEHDYIRLFEVGAGRPFCPLYEGAHRGGRMKIMEELVRFYEHFGLKPAPGDQPDHLCAELQFMHFMSFKEAAACESAQFSRSLQSAQYDFVYRHLGKWLPRLVDRLAQAPEPSAFYSALSAVTAAFCRADLWWLKQCRENPDPQIGPLPD